MLVVSRLVSSKSELRERSLDDDVVALLVVRVVFVHLFFLCGFVVVWLFRSFLKIFTKTLNFPIEIKP